MEKVYEKIIEKSLKKAKKYRPEFWGELSGEDSIQDLYDILEEALKEQEQETTKEIFEDLGYILFDFLSKTNTNKENLFLLKELEKLKKKYLGKKEIKKLNFTSKSEDGDD